MIINSNHHYLINGKFKKGGRILYEDFINVDGIEKLTKDHKIVHDPISVITEYKTFYFEKEKKLVYKDLLCAGLIEAKAKNLYIEDALVLPKYNFTNLNVSKFESRKYLYLNSYNYSTGLSEFLQTYNLPKGFLLKALSTGCPDNEWSNAKEWNTKLQEIINKLHLKDEKELRDYLINKYSDKVDYSKYKIKLDSVFASIITLFVCKDYYLKQGTIIDLYCHTSEMFTDVINFILNFKLKHTVRNYSTNKSDVQIVSINSSLFYEMFLQGFDNLEFLLTAPTKFSNTLYKKIKNKSFYLPNELTSKYLQEFLFRNGSLYTEILDDEGASLFPISKYKEYETYYLLPITDVVDVPFNQLIKLDLK